VTDTTLKKATAKPAPYVGYPRLLVEVHVAVRNAVPRGGTVLVVSRGDEQFVRFEGRRGWHFPRHPDGRWGGFHPANSRDAIEHLESLRSEGAQYIVFPETSLWWLDYYDELREHLNSRYRLASENDTCLIYDLRTARTPGEVDGAAEDGHRLSQAAHIIEKLLPAEARVAVVEGGDVLVGLDPARVVEFRITGGNAPVAATLKQLMSEGADYLVVPRARFDWIDQESELAQELRAHHRLVMRQEHVCEIYELTK
jgi:hypothetical protein